MALEDRVNGFMLYHQNESLERRAIRKEYDEDVLE